METRSNDLVSLDTSLLTEFFEFVPAVPPHCPLSLIIVPFLSLQPFSSREALGQSWLKDLENGKYFSETYVAHLGESLPFAHIDERRKLTFLFFSFPSQTSPTTTRSA